MVRIPEIIEIAGGSFSMGSTTAQVRKCVAEWADHLLKPEYSQRFEDWIKKEYPAHKRTVGSFSIGRFPVTNAEYAQFVNATGTSACQSLLEDPVDDHPAWGMDLSECLAYAIWLSNVVSMPFRLPTEAEWEWAAKGPDGWEFPFGDTFDCCKCNTFEGGQGGTTPVTKYASWASAFGVCDMAGNVEEWTLSYYAPYPGGAVVEDDLWLISGGKPYPILRGGSFALGGDLARSARRHGPHPGERFRYRGFRLVLAY
ncbi:formylglycine-generating enzyme family protein [Leisingera caerulea]|uniref:formylglycine-generating enzyme family protein n=1 Tax=Leisingera caerulea TaxID=506591 RepID=UPI0021A2756E|nr:formylglycine-generating enzyme family protein [Leisingera caerulea]UWQ49916.1 formylglycine-generating enzyme family protein [Leisingera caerulea]